MPAVLDPSGFQISAVIRTVDGLKVNLWTADSGSNESSVNLPAPSGGLGGFGGSSDSLVDLSGMDLPYVESVDVELTLGLSARVTMVFACPFEIGQRLLETNLFKMGNQIEVQIGYPRLGRFTPWVSAQTSKPSIRINGDEGLTVTINGDGGSFAALRGVSNKVYTGKSYQDIIKEIADSNKWAAKFPGDVGFTVVGEDSGNEEENRLTKVRNSVSQGGLSDWFFIQKMARAAGCDAFLAPNEDGKRTIYVQLRKDALQQPPKLRMLMRGNPDFITSFPILNFESESEGVYLPGSAQNVKSRDIEPDTGKTLEFVADALSTFEASLGDAGVPSDASVQVEDEQSKIFSASGNQRSGEYVNTSARDPRGIEEVAQSHRDESTFRGGVTGNITTYGIPELFPGEVVQVLGLGVFNANYYIERLTWSANSSEFMSRLICINNASAGGIVEKLFLEEPASTNTEQVSESSEAEGGGSIIVEPKTEGV